MTSSTVKGQVPLDIVGSTKFGRYSKISVEQTFNMVISDGWLVPYAGYKKVLSINPDGSGRGIYASNRAKRLIAVVDNNVYSINAFTSYNRIGVATTQFSKVRVGSIGTFFGDVFIDENNTNQVAICDKQHLYIYNYVTGDFVRAQLPPGVIPGYVTYQNGRFIIPNSANNTWLLSVLGDGTDWNLDEPVSGAIETKPDLAAAALRVPGRGNLLFVFGNTVNELWTDVGAQIFPYQRNASVNIDYGAVNQATIAANGNYVAWLGANEKSGPVIMYSTGGEAKPIPDDDGINFRLAQLKNPSSSSAFFFKQDGHLFYQITFYDPQDNLTITCDFSNNFALYTMTDQYMNFHIARRVAFFNDQYFFVSFIDGDIYELNSLFTTYDYGLGANDEPMETEIPRVRVCKTFRLPDNTRFIINNMNFVIEQGVDSESQGALSPDYIPRVDLSVSKDGGETFGSTTSKLLNRVGIRRNRINFWSKGAANEFTPQFRFWGKSRFVAGNGTMSFS